MKLLLDAHLPPRLASALRTAGHDVVHTSELPEGNASSDAVVCDVADAQGRVVVTKDRSSVTATCCEVHPPDCS